jgi:hypothetical protein
MGEIRRPGGDDPNPRDALNGVPVTINRRSAPPRLSGQIAKAARNA